MKRTTSDIADAEHLECIRCDKGYLGEDDWSTVEFPARDGLPTDTFKLCFTCALEHVDIPHCKIAKGKGKKAEKTDQRRRARREFRIVSPNLQNKNHVYPTERPHSVYSVAFDSSC